MSIDISQLAFPQVSPEGVKALEIIHHPEPDIAQLQSVLVKDPVLAGITIRHANSPLFRRSHEITNIPAAIRVLGLRSIRSAVVMATLHGSNTHTAANQMIWDHCVATAMATRTIAKLIKPEFADDLEFIGLLHDIGMLVLANHSPELYQQLLERSHAEKIAIDQLELEAFGIQHSSIMNRFYEEFRLPDSMIYLLVNFHQHELIEQITNDSQRLLLILGLSHHLLSMADPPYLTPFTESIAEPLEHILTCLAIDRNQLATIVSKLEYRLQSL